MPAPPTVRRPDVACWILVFGAVGYAVVCIPAIGRRGYPPIDPIWLGVTHLWIAPICLSAIFDSSAFASRRRWLIGYAAVTAFVHAGTFGGIVPRSVTLLETAALTLLLFGWVHLLATFGVEWLLQLALRRMRTLVPPIHAQRWLPSVPLAAWIVGYSIICLAVAFPFAYRWRVLDGKRAQGVALAERDWASSNVTLWQDAAPKHVGDVEFYFAVDPDTGFRREPTHPDHGLRAAYNQRIAELIAQHGLPDWSLKKHVPSADELIALLDATDLERVSKFPYEPTLGIVINNGGSLLTIATERYGLFGIGDSTQPVHVQIDDALVVVRSGSTSVAVFHKNGQMIASADRP